MCFYFDFALRVYSPWNMSLGLNSSQTPRWMLCFSLDVVSLSGDELHDLLCLVAQQPPVPLCVNNCMLQAIILPVSGVSLHMSSGPRELLLNIISPLSHFWSLILALTCGAESVLRLAPEFSWTIWAGDYLVSWSVQQLQVSSLLLQCIYIFESADIFEFAKVPLQTALSVLEIIVLSHCR